MSAATLVFIQLSFDAAKNCDDHLSELVHAQSLFAFLDARPAVTSARILRGFGAWRSFGWSARLSTGMAKWGHDYIF
jgi:hypothetical protein